MIQQKAPNALDWISDSNRGLVESLRMFQPLAPENITPTIRDNAFEHQKRGNPNLPYTDVSHPFLVRASVPDSIWQTLIHK